MTEAVKLLPCPFCGGTNIDPEGWVSTERKGPACDDCAGCADTVELWNSRPLSQAGAGGVVVRPLEWSKVGQLVAWATPAIGVSYAIQEFGSWTDNPFQLTIREADDAKTIVQFFKTLAEAKTAAQQDYEARIRSALAASPPAPVQTASVEAVADILKRHIKVDATGISPAVVSHYITGFDQAARAVLASLTAPTQGAPTPAASNPQSACAGEEAGQAAGEAHRAPAATPSSPVSSPSPAGGVREALEAADRLEALAFSKQMSQRPLDYEQVETIFKAVSTIRAALSSPATPEPRRHATPIREEDILEVAMEQFWKADGGNQEGVKAVLEWAKPVFFDLALQGAATPEPVPATGEVVGSGGGLFPDELRRRAEAADEKGRTDDADAMRASADIIDSHYLMAASLQAQLAAALSALRPFADAIEDNDDSKIHDSADIWEAPIAMQITYGNLRAARRAALNPAPGHGEGGL